MIKVYKILTNKYDTNINFSFETQQNGRTILKLQSVMDIIMI